ncbi:virulence protein [Apilactobacillus timberlakei]|uniref:virulence-associated E family protein n=1 Tax=Apilactobacillus timberlakei TaxID=2008380 RepID=UPI00112D9CC7|nr:virulence-associated E family protein [Apilactobacillus timberlakei]TPR19969.1 virulence protein [Apilactobacillus timberlakei]TPR21687.1 virulence protein [Apilactobacillus timberlakei]TPR22933.1 virulence protein [Apilactobacillus timberlakei]
MAKKKMPDDLKKESDDLKIISMENTKNGYERNDDGKLKSNSAKNVRQLLLHDDVLKDVVGWNDFTQTITVMKDIPELLIKKGTFRDIYKDMISGYIEDKFHIIFKKDIFISGLKQAAVRQIFNPVIDRINAEKWDKVKRVDTFFIDFLGAENSNYVKQVTRKWLTGAVARALRPGIKFELMPVLIGQQGLGKSTLCNSLCPEYFLDNLPSLSGINKDNLMLIKDNWIVEVAELSAMSKTAIEGTKAFISTRVDKYKAPYASTIEDHARRCVFIGTTNESEFLKDKTGNRRFLPIQCGINKPTKNVFKISPEYILQLLAEARTLYENHEPLYLDEDTSNELANIQKENTVEDPLEESIKEYLDMPVPEDWEKYTMFQKRNYYNRYKDNDALTDKETNSLHPESLVSINKITTKEILQVILDIHGHDLMMASRGSYGKKIALVMNSNKEWYKPKNIRMNGRMVRGWKKL